jgi:hypothetical protein
MNGREGNNRKPLVLTFLQPFPKRNEGPLSENFLGYFYDTCAAELFQPLHDLPEIKADIGDLRHPLVIGIRLTLSCRSPCQVSKTADCAISAIDRAVIICHIESEPGASNCFLLISESDLEESGFVVVHQG